MQSIIIKAFTSIFLVMYIAFTTNAQFAGGEGKELNPYQIETVEQLDSIRHHLKSNHFVLMNDLDFKGTVYDSANSVDNKGWNPIGNYSSEEEIGFESNFNGRGHLIKNLYIDRPTEDYVGLFGYTHGANFDSISIEDCNITGNEYVGGLVGRNSFSCEVNHSYTTGIVTGKDFTGGLVGSAGWHSEVTHSYSTCIVTGKGSTGGLVGHNSRSTIVYSYATGKVSGTSQSGGLVGWSSVGSTLNQCYATGNVLGTRDVGGLEGYNYSSSTVNQCYATGDVYGTQYRVGGLVGFNATNSKISQSYSTGRVFGTRFVGALVGRNEDSCKVDSCFWNTETSGIDSSDGGTGRTTQEMKTESTYTDSGWNFDSVWAISADVSNGYPYLLDLESTPVNWEHKSLSGPSWRRNILTTSISTYKGGITITAGLEQDTRAEFRVYDISGRRVFQDIKNITSGKKVSIQIPATALKSCGMYIVEMRSEDRNLGVCRFMKMK